MRVVGFDLFPEMFVDDADLGQIWSDVQGGTQVSVLYMIVFFLGGEKTVALVEESYNWSRLLRYMS